MRLYGYDTISGTLGKDVHSFNVDDLNGNKPFQWLDTIIGGYSDIHTIDLIETYGFNRGYDYKFVRDNIKQIVVNAGSGDEEQGFNSLTSDQKIICAKMKIGTFNQRVAVLGLNDLITEMITYRFETQKSRDQRSIVAEVELRNRLNSNTADILSKAGALFVNYKLYGVDGMMWGDTVPGIADYIDDTPYYQGYLSSLGVTGVGLRNSGYVPDGMSISEFCDRLIDILIHGKYNYYI